MLTLPSRGSRGWTTEVALGVVVSCAAFSAAGLLGPSPAAERVVLAFLAGSVTSFYR